MKNIVSNKDKKGIINSSKKDEQDEDNLFIQKSHQIILKEK